MIFLKKVFLLNLLFIFTLSYNAFAVNNSDIDTSYVQFKSNIPSIIQQMFSPDFWIKSCSNPDKIIIDKDKINKYNKSNINNKTKIVDLEHYKTTFTKDELTKLITKLSSPAQSPRYDKYGKQATDVYYNNLKTNLNLDGLKVRNEIQYGLTVKRTNMRTYPTNDTLFKSGDNYEFDRFMETSVYPIEPLVILSTSKDGNWYFAQIYNYLGWIKAEDVALTTKKDLFDYINNKHFLIVTGKSIHTNYNPLNKCISELKIDMSVKIPLAEEKDITENIYSQNPSGNYVVKIPTRNRDGNVKFELALIPMSEDVNIGYLPYTQSNIIKEAFKLQGERYGWGGMFDARDCTAFVMDVFRTMGLYLPRNSGEQEKTIGLITKFSDTMTLTQREKIYDSLKPGTALYMNGHAMLYLGKYNNKYYMIHDFSGFYKKTLNSSTINYYKSREIAVTPLTIWENSKGKTYMQMIYQANNFQLNKN